MTTSVRRVTDAAGEEVTQWEVFLARTALPRRGRGWRIVVSAPVPDSEAARDEVATHARRVLRKAHPDADVAPEGGRVCLLSPATRTTATNRAYIVTELPVDRVMRLRRYG